MDQSDQFQIHVFGDASMKGYGSSAYLCCWSNNGFESVLVRAVSRVVPLKRVTLPRVEMLGCVIASKLLVSV